MLFKDIEVMAPVGSWESLSAAIKAGCNSIYFGVEQLNMRARSSINFTVEDLAKVASVCKENNIKSYITLNTTLYDHDINLMKSIMSAAKENGIDSVIVSDHAAMNYAKKIGYPVHISTQCNISNIDTVEFYAMERVEDVTGSQETIDIPSRFGPAIVSGLTYWLAIKRNAP